MMKISGTFESPIPAGRSTRNAAPAISEPAAASDAAPDPSSANESTAARAQDTVSLSSRATDAASLLQGIASASEPASDPRVQALTHAVADGSYRPDARQIASALVSHERAIARKLDRG